MGIDLSRIKNFDDLLSRLGEGDWVLTLPNNYPDLVVTPEWRETLIADVASRFVRWVIVGSEGTQSQVFFEDGSPADYDDPLLRLTEYPNLDEWLENAYAWNDEITFDDDLDNEILLYIDDLFKPHMTGVVDRVEVDEVWWAVREELFTIEIPLIVALRDLIGRMPTAEAWRRYEKAVRAQLAEEEKQAEAIHIQHEDWRKLTREFWLHHFSDVAGQRLEMLDFKLLNIGERLEEALLDTDPEIVKAIAEVGFPGKFSNTVRAVITYFAQKALKA